MQAHANLRTAWRLFRSDETVETVVAAVLVAVTLGPVVLKMRNAQKGGER